MASSPDEAQGAHWRAGCPPAPPGRSVSPGWSAAGNSGARSGPPGAAAAHSPRSLHACGPCPPLPPAAISRLSSTSSVTLATEVLQQQHLRVVPGWQARPQSGWGASTCRQSSSSASQVGASRSERQSTTSKCGASWCIRVTASADLPMPPMPSTLTTRQRSCTTHAVKVSSSCSRP